MIIAVIWQQRLNGPEGERGCRATFEIPDDEGIRLRVGQVLRIKGTIQGITTEKSSRNGIESGIFITVALKDVVYD